MDNVWNIIGANLPTIITLLLGISFVWLRVEKLIALAKETQEFLLVSITAFEDGKVDETEARQMVKEAKDVKTAAKNLLTLFKTPK